MTLAPAPSVTAALALTLGCLGLAVLTSSPAQAQPRDTLVRLAGVGLQITAPTSAALGSAPAGQPITASLGAVTVSSDSALLSGWTATVSLGSPVTVTQGGQSATMPASRVKYWSGAATASSGIGLDVCLPGQATAVAAAPLSSSQTAYACGAIVSLSSSLTWRPTLVIQTSTSDPVGTYSGAVTHSVS